MPGPAEMLAMEAAGSSQWMDPIEPGMEAALFYLAAGGRIMFQHQPRHHSGAAQAR